MKYVKKIINNYFLLCLITILCSSFFFPHQIQADQPSEERAFRPDATGVDSPMPLSDQERVIYPKLFVY